MPCPATRSSRIDWRQSARSGREPPEGWLVRQTEWDAAQTVYLWRDGSPSMGWRSRAVASDKRDRASLLLLALASLLLRGGERAWGDPPRKLARFRVARGWIGSSRN